MDGRLREEGIGVNQAGRERENIESKKIGISHLLMRMHTATAVARSKSSERRREDIATSTATDREHTVRLG